MRLHLAQNFNIGFEHSFSNFDHAVVRLSALVFAAEDVQSFPGLHNLLFRGFDKRSLASSRSFCHEMSIIEASGAPLAA